MNNNLFGEPQYIDNIPFYTLNLQEFFSIPFNFPASAVLIPLHSLSPFFPHHPDLLPFNFLLTLPSPAGGEGEIEKIFALSELNTLSEIKSLTRKIEWIGSRLAAKIAFKKFYPELELNSIIIENDRMGAPYIPLPPSSPRTSPASSMSRDKGGLGETREQSGEKFRKKELSISHSGNYAIAVISDLPLGLDIEEILPRQDIISPFIFTDYEIELINSFDGQKKDELVTRLWSLKESLVKLLKTGLTIDLNNIEIHLPHLPVSTGFYSCNRDYEREDLIQFEIRNKSREFPTLKNILLFCLKKEVYIISLALELYN